MAIALNLIMVILVNVVSRNQTQRKPACRTKQALEKTFLELRKADIVKKTTKENKDTKQTQLECLFSAIAVS